MKNWFKFFTWRCFR